MQQLKKERILQVFRLQEERAKIHHDFSRFHFLFFIWVFFCILNQQPNKREFKLFLLHKDEEKYNEIVKEITKKFGEKSLQIRGIISELQESKEDNELQSNLENLQALEKHLLLLVRFLFPSSFSLFIF